MELTHFEPIPCPICHAEEVCEFYQDKRRTYLRCPACGLVFVPPDHFLSAADEKKRYDLHQNSPEDPGYRRFLRRLFVPLSRCLAPGSRGLDFGSGPRPVLSLLFEEAGHVMTNYDPLYEPGPSALKREYDFITAVEVAEHLREPEEELDRLWACLKRGGWLGIMTRPVVGPDEFPSWHYKNDLTHVCFYSRETFAWLAGAWDADLTFPESDVVLFRKRPGQCIAGAGPGEMSP